VWSPLGEVPVERRERRGEERGEERRAVGSDNLNRLSPLLPSYLAEVPKKGVSGL